MRTRTLALAAVIATGMVHASAAFTPHRAGPLDREPPFVTAGRDARSHRNVTWATPAGAQLGALRGWHAVWDADTGVPLRMWSSVAAPGTLASAAAAEAFARQFLADHLGVLAPGAQLADFTLVANQLGGAGDTRTVAFEQRQAGLRVLGGSIGFAFKGDHLTMVSSTALPGVTAPAPATHLVRAGIAANAITWLAGSGHAVRERTRAPLAAPRASLLGEPGERVILPIIHDRTGAGLDLEYRVAESVVVESTTARAGRWQVYLDAATGAPLARANVLELFAGTIAFDTTDQSPTQGRTVKPAPFVTATINGQSVTADGSGAVQFTGANPASVQVTPVGQYVAVTDVSQALATDSATLADAGRLTWSEGSDGTSEADLDAYVAANRAKAFVRAQLNPQLAWLDQQMSVNVNDNSDSCNAYSTGDDVHFYVSGPIQNPEGALVNCENTGRMADVVMHETGHSVHNNSYIPGQGAFGPPDAAALSEGLADTLAVSITGDHGLGRGFYQSNDPLRDVDPVGLEKRWPFDADGEPHDMGEIEGESLWDLRTALVAKLGAGPGFAQLLKIYYGIMQRSPDIPSSYVEALVADDDDGDLTNGTPNQCEIDAAFATHGLADPALALGLPEPVLTGYDVSVASPVAHGSCPVAQTIASGTVVWRARFGTNASIPLVATATGFGATIPTLPDGSTLEYQVNVVLADGAILHYPDNKADPYYEVYEGAVSNVYCTGFEAGLDGWTHAGTKDEWEVGAPEGLAHDPTVAHGGSNVAGIDLGSNGKYSGTANEVLTSPMIDLNGASGVRLQYWRWLTVEDSAYDQATISANGKQVWKNATAHPNAQDGLPVSNHLDSEWVFEDVDLGAAIGTGSQVQLAFGLVSDRSENLGGWNIDDVCIVARVAGIPPVTCGNGIVDSGETCDDGNTTDGDGCSATCQTEDATSVGGGGCSTTGGGAAGGLAIALALVITRRRAGRGAARA